MIHLGAKYSPCMRNESNFYKTIEADRLKEQETACCIRNDRGGCVQTSRSKCAVSWFNLIFWCLLSRVDLVKYQCQFWKKGVPKKFFYIQLFLLKSIGKHQKHWKRKQDWPKKSMHFFVVRRFLTKCSIKTIWKTLLPF